MITARLLGALLVGLGIVTYTFGYRMSLVRAGNLRNDIISVLKSVLSGIESGVPLGRIFHHGNTASRDGVNLYLHSDTDGYTALGKSFFEALSSDSPRPLYDALEKYGSLGCLTFEERERLLDFALSVGTHISIDKELEECREVIRFMENVSSIRQTEDKKRGTMFIKLGVLAAAFIVICVI